MNAFVIIIVIPPTTPTDPKTTARYLDQDALLTNIEQDDLQWTDKLLQAKFFERWEVADEWARTIRKENPTYRTHVEPICISNGPDMISAVREFSTTFNHPINPAPMFPTQRIRALRNQLDRSEFDELRSGDEADDIYEVADGICDLIYVLIGRAFAYGIPLAECFAEVQRANMAKLWSDEEWNQPNEENYKHQMEDGWYASQLPLECGMGVKYIVHDATGKVKKPPSWTEPDIRGIIDRHIAAHKLKADNVFGHTMSGRLRDPDALTVPEEEAAKLLGFNNQEEYYHWRRSHGDTSV
jgi:predicted HAD superfamily Cof-like phosphohydrolase